MNVIFVTNNLCDGWSQTEYNACVQNGPLFIIWFIDACGPWSNVVHYKWERVSFWDSDNTTTNPQDLFVHSDALTQ